MPPSDRCRSGCLGEDRRDALVHGEASPAPRPPLPRRSAGTSPRLCPLNCPRLSVHMAVGAFRGVSSKPGGATGLPFTADRVALPRRLACSGTGGCAGLAGYRAGMALPPRPTGDGIRTGPGRPHLGLGSESSEPRRDTGALGSFMWSRLRSD